MTKTAKRVVSFISDVLPAGMPLPGDQWARRHRAIVCILWLHAAGLGVLALLGGYGLSHSLVEASLVAAFALAGSQKRFGGQRLRAVATAAGLVMSSAVLVHITGGVVETHFHFFVVIGVITLYQDWTVFLTAILFVATHHGAVGALRPEDVYNHQAAWNNPWKWAGIHAAFVLAASAAQVAAWRFAEDQYLRAEAQLGARDRRFRALIENSSDGISVVSGDGSIIYDSPSVAAILGYGPGERAGQTAFDSVHPDDLDRAAAVFARVLEDQCGETVSLELRARHRDGTWRHLEARVKNLLDAPDVGGIVANFRDISDRKLLEERLTHRAFHDPLTELPNRALFLDRIDHAIATQHRTGEPLAVLFVDLDDFKTVNDGLGHAAGDQVLTTLATRLASCLREVDTCARLGGDEFGVLLEGLRGPAEAYEVGARILETFADPIDIESTLISLNASLGIVVSMEGDDGAAALVRNADLAMYRAKTAGKGRYEIFEAGMHDAVVERLALKADLRRGVDAGEFIAHYQPIIEISTGEIIGAEALVRWHHPDRGVLPPGVFLDLAEETGLIVPIGSAVLRQACTDASAWHALTGRSRTVGVNLSASQLRQPGIVEEVAQVLAESGLAASTLTIELTETLLMEDPEQAALTLSQLKTLGVRIALDDFGTGYSSLSYLGRFPVDDLKIDKTFVDALTAGEAHAKASLVGAITGIGELLNLHVTAEGVETNSQLSELRALGCQYAQGYYFARPAPPADFLAELQRLAGPTTPRATTPRPTAGVAT